MIRLVKKEIFKTNPKYNYIIKRLYVNYDMKFVTFGIDDNSDLIMQFSLTITTYTTSNRNCSIPIIDQNKHTNSYTEIQISKPYIAFSDEIYIS